MGYPITSILTWAKASQALAAIGESKRLATQQGNIEERLDVKLYVERLSLQYAYDQDPTSNETFNIGQWVLALCGIYLFEAQQATGGGGSISPVTPPATTVPNPYDWVVSGSSFPLSTGQSSITFDGTGGTQDLRGYNMEFTRGNLTQNTVDPANGGTWYGWNRVTGLFQLFNGVANNGEPMRILPSN